MINKGMPKKINNRLTLRKKLAHGGHGDVGLYYDTSLKREVAVKRLRRDSDKLKKRFAREAMALAQFNHVHIIYIHDVVSDGTDNYQVLEYANAGTLGDEIKRRRDRGKEFSFEEITEIILALTDALQAIHIKLGVHRDIKPDNVLMHRDELGQLIVKLGDFGVAHTTHLGSALTGHQDVLGTLPYMAPETLRGVQNSPKSDIYSLGILLYKLLTKRHYLQLAEDYELTKQIILQESPRPVQDLRPDTPDWLAKLVHQMLDKKSARRPDAREVWQTIQNENGSYSASHQIVKPSSVPRHQFIWAIGMVTVFTCIISVIIINMFIEPIIPPVENVIEDVNVLVEDTRATLEAQVGRETAIVSGADQFGGLKLRSEPSAAGEIIAYLADGTQVESVAIQGAWVNIRTSGQEGWVFGEYLQSQ